MKKLFEGTIGSETFEVYTLKDEHIEDILELQQKAYDVLDDKKKLEPLTNEEFEVILGGKGLLIGAFTKGQLIAIRALYIPDINENHLGYFLGLTKDEELKRVLYQEISIVHPDFRGFGMQKQLGQVIMKEVATSQYDYVCATVMPYNIPSLKDKFSQGFRIVSLTYLYEGKLRYVFAMNLHEAQQLESKEVSISMGDITAQQDLIKEGYVGIRMEKVEDDWYVIYKKEL